MAEAVLLDCDEGRQMGCQSFCCRLIVRLTPEERERRVGGVAPPMGCIPKDPGGHCVHLDRQTHRCAIWEERPEVCRGYDCNGDRLLQVVLREGLQSLRQLVESRRLIPREAYLRIPSRG
jgi:hypothetical protein